MQTFVVSDWRTLSSSSPSAPSTAGADLLSFGGEAATAEGSSGSRPLSIYDLVSTGAPTAHSLGFRRGGLVTLQNELTAAQKDMRQMDDQLKAYLRGERTRLSPPPPLTAAPHMRAEVGCCPSSFDADF